MDYDNTNTGGLFKNDKGDNEKRPDYRGSININGAEYWLSAWIRTAGENSKTPGQKFLSLKAEEPFKKAEKESSPVQTGSFQDDDVPF